MDQSLVPTGVETLDHRRRRCTDRGHPPVLWPGREGGDELDDPGVVREPGRSRGAAGEDDDVVLVYE